MIYYKFIDSTDNKHKVQHEAGMGLLKEALLGRFDISITEDSISNAEGGKPFLPDHPDIFFNISHCTGLCCCIVMQGSECGIDCERIRPARDRVAERIMTAEEKAYYSSLPPQERELHFFVLWTLKEAYGKYTGAGIADMKKVSFNFSENGLLSNHRELCFKVFRHEDFLLSVCTPISCGNDITTDFGLQIY